MFRAYLRFISSYVQIYAYISFKSEALFFKNLHPLIIILCFAFFGYIAGLLLKWSPLSSGSGIPQIEGELLGVMHMNPVRVMISKFIGGVVAEVLAKIMKKDINEQRFMITTGASAGLAAPFNAPFSGTIFTLEEMHKNFSPLVLLPCIIASIVADFVYKNVFGLNPSFYFITLENHLPLQDYWHIILLGILTSILGVIFNYSILKAQDFFKLIKLPKEIKIIIPFILSVFIGYEFYSVLGGGHSLVEEICKNLITIWTLCILIILKLLFTAISYGSGTQGGIFLPVLVLGALSGALYYSIAFKLNIISQEYMNTFIILAMAGILTAVVRSPILSIMLVTEMVGSFSYMLSFCLVTAVSYEVAESLGFKPIYDSLLERMLHTKVTEDTDAEEEKVIFTHRIFASSTLVNKKVSGINLPENCLLVSLKRGEDEFIPHGETLIKPMDFVTILCDKKYLAETERFFMNS